MNGHGCALGKSTAYYTIIAGYNPLNNYLFGAVDFSMKSSGKF